MAQVTIKTTDNVQAKIDGSQPGDELIFDAMSVTGINGKGDRTYKFTKLSGGSGGTPAITWRNQSNFIVTGLFDNGNLSLETCSRATVNIDTKNLRGRSGNGTHVLYFNKLTDSKITMRATDQIGAGVDTCIFGNDPVRVSISDGVFNNCHEPIHLFWFGNYFDEGAGVNVPTDVYVERNVIVGIERHAIELQGGPNGLFVRKNHISKRLANGINISCATGGRFSDGNYKWTNNIVVEDNVCDNGNWAMPGGWSQCMGIEAMGRIKVRNNYIVNGGQGIATTYNSPDTVISGNKFKAMTANQIVSDVPHDKYIQPKPENFTGNVLNYTGAIPTAAELIGGQPDPIPTPEPTMQVKGDQSTTYTTYATIECSGTLNGNTVLECCGADRKWFEPNDKATGKPAVIKALPVTIDAAFDPVKYKNWWLSFRLRNAQGSSPEIKVQLSQKPDPTTTPPPGTPTTTEHVIEFPPILVEGQPVKLVRTVKVTATGNRTVEAK